MKTIEQQTDMPVIMYTPKGPMILGEGGPFLISRLMWREIRNARELIWRMFVRDFSTRYRQSVLGLLWAVLGPLVTVAMFVGINRAGVLKIEGVGVPYALYAILGLSIWNLFTVGMSACTNAIVNAGNMVIKINFPKIALVLAASLQGVVDLLIRAVLVAATFIWFGIWPDFPGLVLGILSIIPLYLLMTGLGFMLSLVTSILRDVTSVLGMALTGGMLVTPILYPIQGLSLLAKINAWNPFNYLINVPRDLIIKGKSPLMYGYILSAVLSVVVFYIGWRFFYLAQTKIAERV